MKFMWGMIAKLTLHPGKREEMADVLRSSAHQMPGSLSYVVAKDSSDENVLWVTEVWNSEKEHEASLSLPQVKAAIPRAKGLVAKFERIAVTEPVWDGGSQSKS
jgi:quinol monooxygenase YgiN